MATVSLLQVAEEMSEFCGSLPDLDDFKAVDDFEELPDELKNHIRLLKDVLSHYRSGPLPKTIKMLPHLPGYESLLEMLSPLEWTSHTYPRIVKVFASKGGDQAFQYVASKHVDANTQWLMNASLTILSSLV